MSTIQQEARWRAQRNNAAKLSGHPIIVGSESLWLSGAEYLAANEEIALAWQDTGNLTRIVGQIIRDASAQAIQRDHTSPLL